MARRFRQPLLSLRVLAAAALVPWLAAPVLGQGALTELRTDVRTSVPDSPQPSESKPRESDDDHDWDEDSSDDSLTLEGLVVVTALAGMGVTAPFWGPPVLIGDGYMQPAYFSHYPYEYGPSSYLMLSPPEAAGLPGSRQPYTWAARGHAEYGSDFQDMEWVGGHLLLDSRWRFGVETDFRHVRENITQDYQDSLWLGDANLLFRFAQNEWIQMRTGLGLNYLSDAEDADFGFNFTYGGDWFPLQPFVFSADLDLGTLGSANLYHLRTTVGVNWGICEAYVGYDYYDIGPTQVRGLVSGVRLWY